MSSFILKIIAMISMLLDHIGFVFYNHSFLRIIGRLAFPIFAFQSVVGYEHTKDKKKHFWKLFIFALISQIPYYLMVSIDKNFFGLNTMFTILLGLLAICIFNKINNHLLGFLFVLFLAILGYVIHVDYGFFGILTIFLFYYFKDSKTKTCIAFIILFTLCYILHIIYLDTIYYSFVLLATISALIPICLYNKKEGIKTKYLFYVFYPLHMLIIWLIFIIFD